MDYGYLLHLSKWCKEEGKILKWSKIIQTEVCKKNGEKKEDRRVSSANEIKTKSPSLLESYSKTV